MPEESAEAAMEGFDRRFRDFPDYIIGITKEIWEGRGLATLHDYYAPDIVLRMPLGVTRGNEGVIAGTMSTLVEFPDRQLLAEDVIWSGSPAAGMLSSHRLVTTATQLGAGVFGPPTGRQVAFRAIADCHAIRNAIDDEWLVRDYGHLVRQLGLAPEEAARRLIDEEGGPAAASRPLTPESDVEGPYRGRGNDDEWGARYAEILGRIMNAELAVIPETYDRAVAVHAPGGRAGWSWAEADRHWMGLRAAFPDAAFAIHHQIGRDDAMMPPRAAIRWSLWGKHAGWGAFGRPSGAMVYVLGISHAEFGPWGLRREYTLYDEVAIWKQILLHAG